MERQDRQARSTDPLNMPGRSGPPGQTIEIDAIVIGAGPVGLFQVFQLGLQEIKCHVIDSLPHPGGQCVELYPDKPIYDIPGVPFCTGAQLVSQLLEQIKPFGATFHLGQEVSAVARQADGRFLVQTAQRSVDGAAASGISFLSKIIVVAAGVGSFQPRKLKVDGIDAFEGRQVHYAVPRPGRFAGQHLVVIGGDAPAIDGVLRLSDLPADQAPASVVLVHRRDVFNAPASQVAALRERIAAHRIQFAAGQITGFEASNDAPANLTGIKLTGPDAVTRVVACDALLSLQGLSPKLGPIADWGLALERKQVVVDTESFQSSTPGVFAVGDINTYPGKKKLILCGFHEATLAAFGAAPIVHPDRRVQLQYTTTSPKLHQLLGVESPRYDD